MKEISIKLFFITGLPKTGTTWCMNLLNTLPKVKVLGEGRFFGGALRNLPPLYEQLNSSISNWVEFIGKRKRNWLMTDEWITTVNKTNYIDPSILHKKREEITNSLINNLLYWLAEQVSKSFNCDIIGEKTPIINIEDIKQWTSCFKEEKFIILKRNFIDWSVSVALHFYNSNISNSADRYNVWFNDKDFIHIHEYKQGNNDNILREEKLWELAEIYKNSNLEIEKAKKQSPDRVLIVNYETLFLNPFKEFKTICDFLDINVSKETLKKAIESVSMDNIKQKDEYMKNHIRIAYPGKGKEFFSYDLRPFTQYLSNADKQNE